MSEEFVLTVKKPYLNRDKSDSRMQRTNHSRSVNPSVDRILFLQKTVGNQVVQRLLRSGTLQAKLRIGQPGDVYEQEADRVADEVMRIPEPEIQRQEEEEEEEMLRANSREDATPEISNDLESQVNAIKGSSGRPLSESERAYFEPRFGHDFTQVRLHIDSQAAESARAVNAQAFTVGRDIAFGSGKYAPGTSEGRRLMAHELTHVVQQNEVQSIPILQREVAVPNYRDCSPVITGIADSNRRLETARGRARRYVFAAMSALLNAPVPGTTYATALNRHFINPSAAERTTIRNNYRQILNRLVISNFICNSQNICGSEQAFWIAEDDLIHVCRPFWPLSTTCQAIILIHESVHDVFNSTSEGAGYRSSAAYPTGNVAPPVGQTTANRILTPDAYAFFAAHIWRNTDTGTSCF